MIEIRHEKHDKQYLYYLYDKKRITGLMTLKDAEKRLKEINKTLSK